MCPDEQLGEGLLGHSLESVRRGYHDQLPETTPRGVLLGNRVMATVHMFYYMYTLHFA